MTAEIHIEIAVTEHVTHAAAVVTPAVVTPAIVPGAPGTCRGGYCRESKRRDNRCKFHHDLSPSQFYNNSWRLIVFGVAMTQGVRRMDGVVVRGGAVSDVGRRKDGLSISEASDNSKDYRINTGSNRTHRRAVVALEKQVLRESIVDFNGLDFDGGSQPTGVCERLSTKAPRTPASRDMETLRKPGLTGARGQSSVR
jgi:hypothetical protein